MYEKQTARQVIRTRLRPQSCAGRIGNIQSAMFPVDLKPVDCSELNSSSLNYLSSLDTRASHDWFQTSPNSKFPVTRCNIQKIQLFNNAPECVLLTLHSPDAPLQAVAIYLYEKWWPLDDVLRSSRKSRNGLEKVQSTVERVMVLVLSQVVDIFLGEKQLFSNHCPSEKCKLMWAHGEAVGFYSFKLKGCLCENSVSQCYELPVLDTIFVRSRCRKRGFGLHMLEDFCNMFPNEEVLGVSSPLSAEMVAVCQRFLIQHNEYRDFLYEAEAPGSWIQRRNIWLNIRLGRYSQSLSRTASETEMKSEGDRPQKNCYSSPGKTSPNSGCSETTDSAEADSGPPVAPEESPKNTQTLKCKGQVPEDQDGKELEKTHPTKVKRQRRK